MYNLLVIILQYLSGSVMYSFLLARIKGINLNNIRDGNPGSTNLWRALNWKWGFTALLLDYFKGVFPLSLFILNGTITDKYIIALSAFAGCLGHAFPPMLRFKGGKAIATTFGAWSVLTLWEAPVIWGSTLTIYSLVGRKSKTVEEDALGILLGYLALLPYVVYKLNMKEVHIAVFYLLSFLLLAYKHGKDWLKYFLNRR